MTQATDGGFDRRSLIKKGLVAGGVVATAPIISTFNAPAFALSAGTFGVVFRLNALNTGTTRLTEAQVPPDLVPPCYAGFVYNDTGPVELPIGHAPDIVTPQTRNYTLTDTAMVDCSFTDIQTLIDPQFGTPICGPGGTISPDGNTASVGAAAGGPTYVFFTIECVNI